MENSNVGGKQRLLLIIEDNPLFVEIYRAALEKAGFDVIVAHDGSEGLDLAKKELPAVVIVDILMPGMDGLQVLRALKENPETKHIKVIILTMLDQNEVKKEAEDLGADDFLVKTEVEISEIVDKMLAYFK